MMRIFLGAVLLAGTAFGSLEWQQEEVGIQVHPTQIMAEAIFRFSNTGKEPVGFSDIVVTCGCMTAKPTKPSYAPGEVGALSIMINLRNRDGELRKTVKVRTSDGDETVLTVAGDIPKAYLISTPLIRWGKGDAARQKTVHLRNPNNMPIRLLSIMSSHEALPAELITIREGFEYDVVVARKPDAESARSVIRMATEPPPGERESKIIKLYAVSP